VLKAGTSIGANVHEGCHAPSRNDFLSKMNIALKEAVETEFWLKLLVKTEFLTQTRGENICADCDEIVKILHAIVKTTKSNNNN